MSADFCVIPPGATIGILGGGQLGRMLALAAARLGYRCHSFDPDPRAPAFDVCAAHTVAEFADDAALDRFAADVDVITYEFENVPVAAVRRLEAMRPLNPSARALEIAQDRLLEKSFTLSLGGETARFIDVTSDHDVECALGEMTSAILKSRRFGYDGKGQVRLKQGDDVAAARRLLGDQPAILEAMVAFDAEVSVLIARAADGTMRSYGPVRNVHKDGILDRSFVPAGISLAAREAALALARRIATALGYVGVLGVELFVLGDRVLFNEMAPRVHNSGHWTIEGALTCQFENHVRAVCGLPLGDTDALGPVAMRNLIGSDIEQWPALLADPRAHLHLYGKREARAGRKMGHVTWLGDAGGGQSA